MDIDRWRDEHTFSDKIISDRHFFQMDKETHGQTDTFWTDRQTDKQIVFYADGETERQIILGT